MNNFVYMPNNKARKENRHVRYGTPTNLCLVSRARTLTKSLSDLAKIPCCGSGMFIPDPGSNFFHPGSWLPSQNIPDPESGQATKNLSILTQKIVSKLGDIIRVVHSGSES
jgi:hypothetical protein